MSVNGLENGCKNGRTGFENKGGDKVRNLYGDRWKSIAKEKNAMKSLMRDIENEFKISGYDGWRKDRERGMAREEEW